MNIKKLLIDFVTVFVVTFVVTAIVTYLYSLIAHGAGAFDWEISFSLAIALGIALPVSRVLRTKEKQK